MTALRLELTLYKAINEIVHRCELVMEVILRPALADPGELWPCNTVKYDTDKSKDVKQFLRDLVRPLAHQMNVPSACIRIMWSCPPETWASSKCTEVLGTYVLKPLDDDDLGDCGHCYICGDACRCAHTISREDESLHLDFRDRITEKDMKITRRVKASFRQRRNCMDCMPCCLCTDCQVITDEGRTYCFLCLELRSDELKWFLESARPDEKRRYEITTACAPSQI